MRIFCFTSDRHLWALRAYAYLLGKYWETRTLEMVVAGFTPPDFRLPFDFKFISIGRFIDYPANRWSDAVIKFLQGMSDELFILMLEDYWLIRYVDTGAITMLEYYMRAHPDVARMDLTRDRANNAGIHAAGMIGYLDLVESTPEIPYNFSLQASIWRREMFLDLLRPGESPWETEINANGRLAQRGYRVMGTRQAPLKYLIAIQQGKLVLDGGYQTPEYALPETDRKELGTLEAIHG